jgi:hypothetical protein
LLWLTWVLNLQPRLKIWGKVGRRNSVCYHGKLVKWLGWNLVTFMFRES